MALERSYFFFFFACRTSNNTFIFDTTSHQIYSKREKIFLILSILKNIFYLHIHIYPSPINKIMCMLVGFFSTVFWGDVFPVSSHVTSSLSVTTYCVSYIIFFKLM